MMASPTTTLCPEVIFTPTNDAQITAQTATSAATTKLLAANSFSINRAKRKFSFPASLHSATLLPESHSNVIARTTRRLSANVGDRVSERVRKLSTAMGLGWNNSPSKELLLSQAKFLVTLYVRFRIRRSLILNQQKKKVALQKLQRSMLGIGDVKEVFLAIKEACNCLEQMHIKVYTNIARQITRGPGDFENPEETAILIGTIGKFLFKSEITWGKIISLFCVTAGLSIDLIRMNHEEALPKIIDGFCGVVEDELIPWLTTEQNGWLDLHNHLLDKKRNIEFTKLFSSIILLLIILFFFFINNYILKY